MAKKQRHAQKQPAPHRLPPTTQKHWLNEGNNLYGEKRYNAALEAYDRAIQLDPCYAAAYRGKGNAFLELERYEEALAAYERVIQLDAARTDHMRQGYVNRNLQRYNDTMLCSKMGLTLYMLKRYEEALVAYERAIQLDPKEEAYRVGKGIALYRLERDEE
ncbi:MAG TPA: tetratricopeptide repeat protein, partial [Ktedonobacteraceae bacterium]|nr:tetratricopeptide repeat protein [Ktedonobacteraceae bacterium]